MNWLKKLWSWFTTPSEDTCCTQPHEVTPVEIEEVDESSIEELYNTACSELGVTMKNTKRHRQLFIDWYNGANNKEQIKQCLSEFGKLHTKLGIPQ